VVKLDGVGESSHDGDGRGAYRLSSQNEMQNLSRGDNSPRTRIDRMQSKASSAVDTSS
jgi:hypothetical protein